MRAASFLLSLAAAVASVKGTIVPQRRADRLCNGHAELCNRSYGNVTFLGAHDSFASSRDPFALAADQRVNIPSQLGLGVRLLQAQAHVNDGVLHFCHTDCLLFDGGTVEAYLEKVNTFLKANPNEVLTLIFTNPEGASLKDHWGPAFQKSGIASLAYVPPSIPVKQSAWPTLGELIDSGKRVVVFLDAGADGDRSVPYILPEFPMIWETPFSVTDSKFPCKVDRISGPLATTDHMYMINHSLNKNLFDTGIIIPDPIDAWITNSVPSILAHAARCEGFTAGRAPNFVLLDFVNIGYGLKAVNQLNGLA